MRFFSNEVSRRLSNKIQTRATNSDPSAIIWISRTETPLVDKLFLEQQEVLQDDITDVSIAVCHPRLKTDNTHAYLAYISNGTIKVTMTVLKTKMYTHVWKDTGYETAASAVSIAFDGSMHRNANNEVEFVTDLLPWVFYINEGALYGQPLNGEPVLLAEENCTDVSAVRAMWSSEGNFDFGMVVFFIMAGKLHYRQRINGVWMDAEVVAFGPDDVTWTEIAAFRTWDYRIGLQAMASDGVVYELITQFMGVGKQNSEHIHIRDVNVASKFIGVTYHNHSETERIELINVRAGAPYGGLYSIYMPVMLSAHNEQSEDGDWGKIIVLEFSNYLVASQVAENYLRFSLVDSWGAAYYPYSATLGDDGVTVTLMFVDFNPAHDVCEIRYTPGTIYSMATIKMDATSVTFTPKNLDPPDVPQPEVESIWNE